MADLEWSCYWELVNVTLTVLHTTTYNNWVLIFSANWAIIKTHENKRRGKNSYGQFQISKWDKFRRIFICFACFCRTNSYGNFSYGQFHMHPKNLPRTYSEWLFHMDKFIRNIFVSKFVLTKNLAVYICPGHQRPSEWILDMKSGSINMSLSCCDKFGLIRKFSCFKLGQFQLL